MQRIQPRPLFVAATRQHVGKTSVSLALMAGLKKRLGPNVGFIKPVGQQHKEVHDAKGKVLRVDKDVELLKEYFSLDHLEYNQMSPVLMPKDYTKAYIDGGITSADQESAIRASYDAVEKTSVRVLLEGTGHVGVGSVVELSNARVAAQLGAEMILVANGGIGSAFDELELNRVMCEKHGVPIKGVVLNKVKEDKLAMVRDYFGRLLHDRWGVPLLGVVPDLPFLAKGTLADIEQLLDGDLLSGVGHRPHHYELSHVQLITTGVRRFLKKANSSKMRRPLYVTHVTRDDIVLGYLSHFLRMRAGLSPKTHATTADMERGYGGAMILCVGIGDGHTAGDENVALPYLMELVRAYDAPVMLVQGGTRPTNDLIHGFTAKLNINDTRRVDAAIDHYEPHLDFDAILAS